MKATGNKNIIPKDWEREFLDIIDNDGKNPTLYKIQLHKTPGAAAIGLNSLENVVEMPKPAETRHVSIRPPTPYITPSKPKKNKLGGKETDETSKLGKSDEQRLVLLEQLKLTRTQIEREKLLSNRLRQSLPETQGPESQDPESQGPEIYSSFLDKIYRM
nr:unnamed protein product [Callosobruchus analis]